MPQINLSDEMLATLELAVEFAMHYVDMDWKDADDKERKRIEAQMTEFGYAADMLQQLKEPSLITPSY